MGKIILIATTPAMWEMGIELKKELSDSDNLTVLQGAMDNAVKIAKGLDSKETDAIICRGASGRMLEEMDLNIPIIDISVSDEEVIMAVNSARMLVETETIRIAYIGFIKTYMMVKAYLDMLNVQNIEIVHYDVHNMEEVRKTVAGLQERVDVIIGGNTSCEAAKEYHIKCVLLGGTMKSLEQAYAQAETLQKAMRREKSVSEERKTIINLIREGVLSIDSEMTVTLCNQQAYEMFQRDRLIGMKLSGLCPKIDLEIIHRAFQRGESCHEYLLKWHDKKYLTEIKPVCVDSHISNVILIFQEVDELQKMEIAVRKKIYLKGNVAQYHYEDIKGSSAAINKTIEIAKTFAKVDSSVLILGDTGTGKELFAQSIHNSSARADGPFVAVNCGAIPAQLMESELFGYTDGAFTGAKKGGKAGLFEQAHKGTIFLDEISEMDLYGQVMLLRILQERQVRRVGGDTVIPVDVRIIAACNVDLEKMVKDGLFRKDLYYRLSILVLNIPKLNQRFGDIKILTDYYLNRFNDIFRKNVSLSRDAYGILEEYEWNGNVRQLASFCERLAAISNGVVTGAAIEGELYNRTFGGDEEKKQAGSTKKDTEDHSAVLLHGRIFSKGDLQRMLEECRGNRSEAARRLGIGRMTLYRIIKKFEEKNKNE